MNTSLSTAAIILAAGSSSRMGGGQHKLLLPLDDRPVLAHVIDATLTSKARPIVIVLGHQSDQVRSQIERYTVHHDITLVENTHYQQGMSSSLRLGIQTLLTHGYRNSSYSYQVDSALIVLGVQPLITPRVINTLIGAYRATGKPIVAPLYQRKRGSPVLFDKSLFSELIEVTGDEGGEQSLNVTARKWNSSKWEMRCQIYDVDTWEAYEQVCRSMERQSARINI